MEETQNQQPSTASGGPNGKTSEKRLRLPDLPEYRLGEEGDLNGFDATDIEFLQFVQSLVPVTDGPDRWTWEERRDFLNWCLDEQVLEIKEGRLVPADVEELTPTAPLSEEEEKED